MNVDLQLYDEVLDVQRAYDWVRSPTCGGIDIFIGTVRDNTKGKRVVKLEFESYKSMAIKEMKLICEEANTRWPIDRMCIHHRLGTLEIGEIAVIIAVATPHRKAAFEACSFAIDTLKETVPIWKKEIFEDGEVWVSAHP